MKIEKEEEKATNLYVLHAEACSQEVLPFRHTDSPKAKRWTSTLRITFSKQVTLTDSSLGENRVVSDRKSFSVPSGGADTQHMCGFVTGCCLCGSWLWICFFVLWAAFHPPILFCLSFLFFFSLSSSYL